MDNSNFTTCPIGRESWLLEARRIEIDADDEWGEIWDAKFNIGGVPVFYVPYMTIPISEKRKSGFLFPKFGTSTTKGIELATGFI